LIQETVPTQKELNSGLNWSVKFSFMKVFRNILGNDILHILSNSSFLYFILSVVFSQIASNMMNIILIFLVFFLTSSNLSVSILILTFMIPQIFLSFVGGVIADIRSKKRILMLGNILRAAILVILLINNKSILLVYIISFFISVITQFYVPAESPLIPKLIDKKHLTAANSIFGMALFGSILAGYVMAGPAIAIFGRSSVFILLSILFIIAGYFIYLVPDRLIINNNHAGAKGNLLDGFGLILRKELRSTYNLISNVNGVASSFMLLIFSQIIIVVIATIVPGYAKAILEIPAEDLSLLLFSPAAIGMIVGSFFLGSVWRNKDKSKIMTVGILISGLIFVLFPLNSKIVSRGLFMFINSFLPHLLQFNVLHLTVLISFFAGFANACVFIPSQTILQEKVPEFFRSKIYGLLFALVALFSFFPILISGWVADVFGVGTVLFIMGALILLLGLVRLIKLPAVKIAG